MNFPTRLTRQRPATKPDPMNPRRTLTDWSVIDEVEVTGFLDSQASNEAPDATRAQLLVDAVFYMDDLSADVRRGDRLTDGTRSWTVQGFPQAPLNPFTGWQPYQVVNLKEVRG